MKFNNLVKLIGIPIIVIGLTLGSIYNSNATCDMPIKWESRAEVINFLETGNKDFSCDKMSKLDLNNLNFKRADMGAVTLSGANLSGANLYKADLHKAHMAGANLTGANLYKADLYKANLSQADMSGVNLIGADLSSANMKYTDLYKTDMSQANMTGIRHLNKAESIGYAIFENTIGLSKKDLEFISEEQGKDKKIILE